MTDERATKQEGEWHIVHVLRRTLWHVDEGWDALDPRHQRSWFALMLGGLVALLAVTVGLVMLGRALDSRGLLAWERPFLLWFEKESLVPFSWAIWLESPGNAIILWPLVLASAGVAAWRRRPLAALTLVSGFALLDAAVVLGWTIWKRQRPDFIGGGVASPASFSAFPSGHVSQTIVAYGLLVVFWLEQTRRRGEHLLAWALLALLAAVVGVGRIRLGAHWPSDVIAGAVVGGFWLWMLVRALRKGEEGRRAP
ncbi:MAG TPA: phosphatase PAP2 family protein [Thermoanaerobaculia bacterium]|jgi:undecaprenyl-diphosphatase